MSGEDVFDRSIAMRTQNEANELAIGRQWVRLWVEETPDRDGARRVVERPNDKGFVVRTAGPRDTTPKARPPLVFGCERAEAIAAACEETVRELQ